MKFSVDSKELIAGVLSVIKALPLRSSMPILEGVYIDASENGVTLKSSDLMMQKDCTLCATVEEAGRAIVPGKLFMEVVRKLPDAVAYLTLDEKTLKIECGRSKNNVQCIEYEDFPEMRFQGDQIDISLSPNDWKRMIAETSFAVAQDDSKPILTGVLMELDENITLIATDAYQFAMRFMPLKAPVAPCSIVIPGKTILEVGRMMEEATTEEAKLTFSRTHIRVELNQSVLTARLIDGDYIKYKQLLPKEHKTRVLIDRAELMESLDRAMLMAREGNNNVIMKFHANRLNIVATSFVGAVDENIDVQINGDDIDIAFNPKYCLNILKCIPTEKIYLDFTTPISPCVIRPSTGDGYYYLVVPVRIGYQF